MNSLIYSHPQTENTVKIVVTEVIGDNLCIASDDGQKVYELIATAFKEGKNVILSFKNGEDITPAFLSDAIGHLYATFPEEQIQTSLSVIDIDTDDADMIDDAIYWTKQYLKDPQRFEAAAREAFGDYYE
ncbi:MULTISPECIES: STAS-like domain-containing protein [Argonema]|uniref:STAS-like domain-containing protein n=1 Tax=Argonema TaxID=2942761 RepID=UPI00201227BD|nr:MULTISPECIES: STAS-like domain-containing protein [Argonema]MCL1463176.1 STAS-like domain-containing protein [Argonema galeatum A003/A1]MCL1470280.1 STAS-like domain-containing protein [Argonema antarcticum A004/B2]